MTAVPIKILKVEFESFDNTWGVSHATLPNTHWNHVDKFKDQYAANRVFHALLATGLYIKAEL